MSETFQTSERNLSFQTSEKNESYIQTFFRLVSDVWKNVWNFKTSEKTRLKKFQTSEKTRLKKFRRLKKRLKKFSDMKTENVLNFQTSEKTRLKNFRRLKQVWIMSEFLRRHFSDIFLSEFFQNISNMSEFLRRLFSDIFCLNYVWIMSEFFKTSFFRRLKTCFCLKKGLKMDKMSETRLKIMIFSEL